MRYKITRLILIGFLFLHLSSCSEDFFETVIDADPPPFTPKVVAHAYIGNLQDTIPLLTLTKNREIFNANDQHSVIEDAAISIFKNDQQSGIFRFENGVYVADPVDIFDEVGAEYKIMINAPGFPVAEARQTKPSPVFIDTAFFVPNIAINEDGQRFDGYRISITDPPGSENYYMLTCSKFTSDSTFLWSISLNSLDPLLSPADGGTLLFSDDSFDGKSREFDIYSSDFSSTGGSLRFDLWHISRELFQYQLSIYQYLNNDFDFFNEPVVIFSNIDQGLGIFSISTVNSWYIP
jgi:hypothetical protein